MASPGLQTATIPMKGGLNLTATNQELLMLPNEAIVLENFEASRSGGYRRILGYTEWGDLSIPGSGEIKGIHTYRGGVIAARGTDLYHSFDGSQWTKVNKLQSDVTKTAMDAAASDADLSTTDEKTLRFEIYTDSVGEHLYIATGNSDPAYLLITGDNESTARYTFRWITRGSELTGAKEMVIFEQQMVLANVTDNASGLYYSSFATTDLSSAEVSAGLTVREKFDGSTSGFVSVGAPITGIRAHRNSLYIFTARSILRIQDIQDGNVVVEPITEEVGCVDGNTIQEIEGDLVFLARDGLRTIAGTERFDDVELGVISRKISPITDEILGNLDLLSFTSAVIRRKSQYRLWYRNSGLATAAQRGIIATYSYDSLNNNFRWDFSELKGWVATAAYSGRDASGLEFSVHGDASGKVYQFESGSNFDGTSIKWSYQTPYTDLGDIGIRKNIHKVFVSISAEGSLAPQLLVRYDYESPDTPQPDAYTMEQQSRPAVYGDPSVKYGDPTVFYGSGEFNTGNTYTQGSGFTVSFRITDTDQDDQAFSIESMELDYVINGRI